MLKLKPIFIRDLEDNYSFIGFIEDDEIIGGFILF